MYIKKCKKTQTRRTILSAVILTVLNIGQAGAVELFQNNQDWIIRFDNTVKLNYSQRMESPESNILQTANYNDGNFHFDKGSSVTKRVDLLTEFDVVYRDKFGLRVSAASWYDNVYKGLGNQANPFPNGRLNGGHMVAGLDTIVGTNMVVPPGTVLVPSGTLADYTALSSFAERFYRGASAELLDAFIFFNTEFDDGKLFSGKFGRHTVFWGETLLNAANGIGYGQSSLDLGKLFSVPGTTTKELFMPRNQVSANLTINENWSLGVQYFLEYRNSRFPEGGTYMGPYDMALDGDNVFWLPLPSVTALGGQSAFFAAPRDNDVRPDDQGDFGLMAKWQPDWFDGALGFFYRKTSDTLPFFLIDAPNLHQPGLAGVEGINYFVSYGSNIDLYGVSLATNLGDVSIGIDINYRENMPLVSNFTIINPTLRGVADLGVINGANLIAERPEHGKTGVATGNTLHAVMNAMAFLNENVLWESATLIAEAAITHLIDVKSNEHTYKGHSSYQGIDRADNTSLTLALNFTPTWFQVLPGLDVSMPLSGNIGLSGQSAVQLGGNEKSGSISIGFGADLYQKYRFSLKYVDNFGPYKVCSTGTDNNTPGANGGYQCIAGQITSQAGLMPVLRDRGTLTFSFQTTF